MMYDNEENINSLKSTKKGHKVCNIEENNYLNILNQPIRFELIVGRILGKYYHIESSSLDGFSRDRFYDFKLNNGIYFEVKYVRNGGNLNFIRLVKNYFAHLKYDNPNKIIIVSNITRDENLSFSIEIDDEKIKIITLENLLYLCKDDDFLRSELLLCLNTSTENVISRPLDKEIVNLLLPAKKENFIEKENELFRDKLDLINPGKAHSTKFEDFCFEFIKIVFQDNIEQPETQRKNNLGLYRFDIVAPIKIDFKSRFARLIYDKYNSCFLIFECKNFRKAITQNEIYSTERYLYDNALRNVAIIFSRFGADKNANIARQGVLKEHGKLILVLSDDDIFELEQCYYQNKEDKALPSPFDYLYDKTIKFLMELDK